jgi:hypothetical protein
VGKVERRNAFEVLALLYFLTVVEKSGEAFKRWLKDQLCLIFGRYILWSFLARKQQERKQEQEKLWNHSTNLQILR